MAVFALEPVGAPEFPTQNAEGKEGGGWDMKLPGLSEADELNEERSCAGYS